jgi:DNA-binding NarL/FixJ family response regulator
MDTLKLILADDEPLFRNGISFILQREKDIEVIFEASDGAELLEYLKSGNPQPDIIIMDLKMPLLNGVDATKIISEEFPEIKIIALTSYNTKVFIANMINTGAASYLVKNTTPKNLLTTIREVAAKGFYYDEHVLEVLKEEIHTIKRSGFDNWELTAREREIIKLICMQLSTKEIADKLFINHRTVEGHRNNLLLKTQSKNMAGLVVFALQNNIIQLQDLVN